MSSGEGNKDDYTKDFEEWSSDGEYQRSEDNYWRSDVDWNGGSSMAGEASGVSEATEEEQPEEEEVEEDKKKTPKQKKIDKKQTKRKNKFNVNDVGTDDESRPLDDTAERSDLFKSNISEMTDISDIEDQISEAHRKIGGDKQSMSSVIGLVDKVTVKADNVARKESETRVALDNEIFNKMKLLESSDISYGVDELQEYGDSRKGRKSSVEKDTSGKIEYIESDKTDFDDGGLARNLNLSEMTIGSEDDRSSKSTQSGSVESVGVKDPVAFQDLDGRVDDIDDGIYLEKDAGSEEELDVDLRSRSEGFTSKDESCSGQMKIVLSDNTVLSAEPSINSDNDCPSTLSRTDLLSKGECYGDCLVLDGKHGSENSLRDDDSDNTTRVSPEFDEPECCKNQGPKHVCCFINIGGGGDDGGRESGIINRLKKLKDDIANMREELSHARKECKKESEEVAKLIEEAIARNKAAEQVEKTVQSSNLATPPKTPPAPEFVSYIVEDIRHQPAYQVPVVARAQAPIPTAVLEDRLRATRQTASSSYRESLQQLERMVEKEMASIQDSMTRLEPLNKMAAEWDHLQHVRSRSMTFMRDYRMEMVTKEMHLKADKNLQNQSIEIN